MWSVKEAARLMGISEQRVRRLLKEGRIKGKRLNGTWVVLELGYRHKRGYNPSRGGHAPGHLRDALLEYLDALRLTPIGEKVTPMIDGEPVDLEWLIGQLWNCTDIMPSGYDDIYGLDLESNCTYAQAVRKIKDWLKGGGQ